jgi:hypothetical protein
MIAGAASVLDHDPGPFPKSDAQGRIDSGLTAHIQPRIPTREQTFTL